MMLPPELMQEVLSYIPRRHARLYLTVCRHWYDYLLPAVYKQVHLYSTRQYDHFLETLEQSAAAAPECGSGVGRHVQSITFHTNNIMLAQDELDELMELTPNVEDCDYMAALTDEHLGYFVPGWPKLNHLPSWHEDAWEDWAPALSGQLTRITCDTDEMNEVCKSMVPNQHFSLVTTLNLVNLAYMIITIPQMDRIHKAMPVLESIFIEFEHDMAFPSDESRDAFQLANVAPAPHVLRLGIDIIGLEDDWYKYWQHKYPKLEHIAISLKDRPTVELEQYPPAPITPFIFGTQHLKNLDVDMLDMAFDLAVDLFEFDKLRAWLNPDDAMEGAPRHHLTSFTWLHELQDFDTWNEDTYSDYSGKSSELITVDLVKHLETLTCTIFDTSDLFLNHLMQPPDLGYFHSFPLLTYLDLGFSSAQNEHILLWHHVLRHTPSLRTLALQNFTIADDGEPWAGPPSAEHGEKGDSAWRHPLRSLHLCGCTFHADDSDTLLTHMLAAAPRVSDLKLHQNRFRRKDIAVPLCIDTPHHTYDYLSVDANFFYHNPRGDHADSTPHRAKLVIGAPSSDDDDASYKLCITGTIVLVEQRATCHLYQRLDSYKIDA
ncbi:hypothetical protein BC940DRAFT_313940 [Gongronella butleri]|nr:hypothetical protein BC940DRAFT_313940 [Gongronella butleri]